MSADLMLLPDSAVAYAEWLRLRISYALFEAAYAADGHRFRLTADDLANLPLGTLAVEGITDGTILHYRPSAAAPMMNSPEAMAAAVITHAMGGKWRIDHAKLAKIPPGELVYLLDDEGGIQFCWKAAVTPLMVPDAPLALGMGA